MATIRRFEDLLAWQKARRLTREVYRLTREGVLGRDFGLRDQMERSAVSIMSNIAEGFERGGRPEFAQFLSVAKASCAELRSQIYVAMDVGHLSDSRGAELLSLAEEVTRIVAALRTAVARQRDRITSKS